MILLAGLVICGFAYHLYDRRSPHHVVVGQCGAIVSLVGLGTLFV